MAVSFLSVSAQDVIVKNDGSTILCQIIGVNDNEVIYTRWSNVEGPQYIMDKSLVSNINYQDGRQEKFSEQTSNVYAPGNQQTGASNLNDIALLALDYERHNNLKKSKNLKTVGWSVGVPLMTGGTILTIFGALYYDSLDTFYLAFLIPGTIALAGGIATFTGCLIKSRQYKKMSMLSTASVFKHEFNFKNGSSLSAGVDMIRDKRSHQSTFGLGLQYNF